jgi:branched-chain amino acid aminotransferase
MTGTAAEVTPVRSVDDNEIGVGPVTLELQRHYLDTVRGRSDRWTHWLDRVDLGRGVSSSGARAEA